MAVRGVTTFENTSATLTLATGYTLGLAPGTDRVVMDIEGWHKPAANRRRKTERQGSHGTFGERSYKDERLVSVTGSYRAPDRATAAAFVDDVAAFLAEGTSGVLTVADPDLGERYATVFLDGTDVDWRGGVDVKFTVDLAAPNPRKYGGAVSSTAGPPVDGGGLAYPLFTESRGALRRENLLPDPSFEYATPPDKGGTMSQTRVTYSTFPSFATAVADGRFNGAYALRLTAGGTDTLQYRYVWSGVPVTAGAWLNFAFSASATTASTYATVFFNDASGNAMASPRPSTTKFNTGTSVYSPVRMSLVDGPIQVPAGAASVKIAVYLRTDAGTNPLTGSVYMDTGVLVQGPTPESVADTSFFSGDSKRDQYSYEFNGAPATGTSLEYDFPAHGVLYFGEAGSSGIAEVANVGTADALSKFSVTGYAPGFTIKELETGRRLVYSGTVPAGSVLVIDPVAGTVELDGSDRGQLLTIREWTPVPARGSSRYLFESAGPNARLTVEGVSAWW